MSSAGPGVGLGQVDRVERAMAHALHGLKHVSRGDSRGYPHLDDMRRSEQSDERVQFEGGIDLDVRASTFETVDSVEVAEERAFFLRLANRPERPRFGDPRKLGDPARVGVFFSVHRREEEVGLPFELLPVPDPLSGGLYFRSDCPNPLVRLFERELLVAMEVPRGGEGGTANAVAAKDEHRLAVS